MKESKCQLQAKAKAIYKSKLSIEFLKCSFGGRINNTTH